MRCPWCGSPVIIKGSFWECGYCGDSGRLARIPEKAQSGSISSLTQEFAGPSFIQLREDLTNSLSDLTSQNMENLRKDYLKALVYEINQGLSHWSCFLSADQKSQMEFLRKEAGLPEGADGNIQAAAAGQLEQEICGSFWQKLIQNTPGEDPPNTAFFFWNLQQLILFFTGDSAEAAVSDYLNQQKDFFEDHWLKNRCLSPDLTAAHNQILADDTTCLDACCRDFLVTAFPGCFKSWSAEALVDFYVDDFMNTLYEQDPILSFQMWKVLEDAILSIVPGDSEVAKSLLQAQPFPPEDYAYYLAERHS